MRVVDTFKRADELRSGEATAVSKHCFAYLNAYHFRKRMGKTSRKNGTHSFREIQVLLYSFLAILKSEVTDALQYPTLGSALYCGSQGIRVRRNGSIARHSE